MRRGNESTHRTTCSQEKYPTKRLPDNILRRHFGQQDPRTSITTSERRFCKKAMSAPRDIFGVGIRSVGHWEQTRRYSNGGTKDGVMGKERALRTRMGRALPTSPRVLRKKTTVQTGQLELEDGLCVSLLHCHLRVLRHSRPQTHPQH